MTNLFCMCVLWLRVERGAILSCRHPNRQRSLSQAADHQDLHQRRRSTGDRVQNPRQIQRSVPSSAPVFQMSGEILKINFASLFLSLRPVCARAPYSAGPQVPPDAPRPPRRHRVWHSAAVERSEFWLSVPAVEGHQLLQQVSQWKWRLLVAA